MLQTEDVIEPGQKLEIRLALISGEGKAKSFVSIDFAEKKLQKRDVYTIYLNFA